MAEYLILIAAEDNKTLSAREEEHCIASYGQWAKEIGEKHITGRRLSSEKGDLLPSQKTLVTDGPFVEAKELIAGFILIEAVSREEATKIAASCPLNAYFQLFVKAVG